MTESVVKLLPRELRDRLSRMARAKNKEPDTYLSEIIELAVSGADRANRANSNPSNQDSDRLAPNDLVDPIAASCRLRLSRSKLAAMRCRGTGPKFVKMGARTVYYRVRDLDEYLDRCVVQSTSQ